MRRATTRKPPPAGAVVVSLAEWKAGRRTAARQPRSSASRDALFELEVSGDHLIDHGYADGTVLLLSVNAEYGPDDIVACRCGKDLLLCCPCEGPLGPVVGKVVGVAGGQP